MTPATTKTKPKPRTGDDVLRDLKRLRPQVERADEKLRGLYERQNALYLEGHRLALRATDMARAVGAESRKGGVASGAEAIRQVVKRDGGGSKGR